MLVQVLADTLAIFHSQAESALVLADTLAILHSQAESALQELPGQIGSIVSERAISMHMTVSLLLQKPKQVTLTIESFFFC